MRQPRPRRGGDGAADFSTSDPGRGHFELRDSEGTHLAGHQQTEDLGYVMDPCCIGHNGEAFPRLQVLYPQFGVVEHCTGRITTPIRTQYQQHPRGAVDMWRLILRDPLEVTDEVFWACLREGAIPLRGQPTTTAHSLPVKIVWQLTKTVGLREETVAGMSMCEAIKALQDYWARQAD